MVERGTCMPVIGLLPKQISKLVAVNNECARRLCLEVRIVPGVLVPILDELWIIPVFELEFGEAAAEYEDYVQFVLALLFNHHTPNDAARTRAAFGPLCCESAQWNMTVEICFVWLTRSCTCSSKDSNGELIACLMFPPM